ncbi:MAG: short-chain dehydrogenase [Candidatus Melainabacteria bacterium]|nr:MAG: short-chain dehydrogenase [Candidatus Melainabacteria bacterium]
MNTVKKVVRIYEKGSSHWVGDGFPVRNLIPSSGLEGEIDPFLMLDYAGPAQFEASERPHGVGEHPHRGFETVTIAYQGSVEHRDSSGNEGTIHPGDVQWMTAGSGVVHEEMHERAFAKTGGVFEMIQLWVNLPRSHKLTAPRYQTIKGADIPKVAIGDQAYARIIAGELNGKTGPAQTFTPVYLIDVGIESGEASLKIPAGYNTAIFLLKGRVRINDTLVDGEAKMALLDKTVETISLVGEAESRLLVMAGKPIAEPVASYGPFVMNSKQELIQAVDDYQAGRMGHLSKRA